MPVEREIKLAVPVAFDAPDLTAVVDGAVARPDATRELDATYYDTADLRLARSGITLRNRVDRSERGPDASEWTAKFPAGSTAAGGVLSRHEIDVDAPPGPVPAPLAALVAGHVRAAPVVAVARLVTRRRRLLIDIDGVPHAEVDDDTVTLLAGADVVDEFREIEVEVVGAPDGADALLAAVAKRLQGAGAGAPDPAPKLMRALGERATAAPELDPPRLPKRPTAAAVLGAALAASVRRVIDQHHVIHLDADPEGVHQARVGLRRLSSDLRTFRSLFDGAWADALREESRWLADGLGRVRDADVLLDRLGVAIDRLPDHDRAAGQALVVSAQEERATAQRELIAMLGSERYTALLDRLVDAATAPRFTPAAGAKATKVLPGATARAVRRLAKTVRRLDDEPTADDLHRVRIRAKQARYAADVAVPVVGAPARRFSGAAAGLQDVLGDLHDATVTEVWLRQAGRTLRGARALAAGLLVSDQRREADDRRHEWPRAWKAVRREKRATWLKRS